MADLGALPGDADSLAFGVNDRGQVVGTSIGATLRAFLWQNGVMTDLNTLIKGSTSLDLIFANGINSRGEIAGQAFDPSLGPNGEFRAFLAIPCDQGHADFAGCRGGSQGAPVAQNGRAWLPSPSPQGVRALLQQSLAGRFAAGLMSMH
jgi:probable HAF family extracellular repeat protein